MFGWFKIGRGGPPPVASDGENAGASLRPPDDEIVSRFEALLDSIGSFGAARAKMAATTIDQKWLLLSTSALGAATAAGGPGAHHAASASSGALSAATRSPDQLIEDLAAANYTSAVLLSALSVELRTATKDWMGAFFAADGLTHLAAACEANVAAYLAALDDSVAAVGSSTGAPAAAAPVKAGDAGAGSLRNLSMCVDAVASSMSTEEGLTLMLDDAGLGEHTAPGVCAIRVPPLAGCH